MATEAEDNLFDENKYIYYIMVVVYCGMFLELSNLTYFNLLK